MGDPLLPVSYFLKLEKKMELKQLTRDGGGGGWVVKTSNLTSFNLNEINYLNEY